MTIGRMLVVLLATLAVAVTNVAASVLWVAVYSNLINPGHDAAFYQDHAQWAAPWSSVLAGAVLVYLAARWVARRWESAFAMTAALSLWLAYAVWDLSIMSVVGFTPRLAALSALSLSTKLGAAWLGARTVEVDREPPATAAGAAPPSR